MNENNNIYVNKYPYFLWALYKIKNPKIDIEKKEIQGDYSSAKFEKASLLEIILLKYLPLLLFIPYFQFPRTMIEAVVMFCSFFTILVIFLLYRLNKINTIKYFILGVFVLIASLSFTLEQLNIENYFFMYIQYMGVMGVGLFVYFDIKDKVYKNYYRLSAKKEVNITPINKGKREFMKVPFTKKHLMKYSVKNDFKINFLLGGYYCLVKNKIKEESI